MRDLHELQSEPCRTVCAAPLENNMLCWHGNLRPLSGPYAGAVLHIIMEFAEDYPASPPQVKLCQTIPHPNVFGDYICLDMLKSYTVSQRYAGWSSAYSVQSILLQLQGFLFAENIPQEHGGPIKAYSGDKVVSVARAWLDSFACAACGHTSAQPQPPLPEVDAFYCLLERRQSVICFHSKRTHEEDVLGVGISLEHFPGQARIKAINTSLDVLSLRAFTQDRVRLSVWKEPFRLFLPLVIGPDHFGRAREHILDTLSRIENEGGGFTGRLPQWTRDPIDQARMLLAVLPKLMNSFVVSLMNNNSNCSTARGFGPRTNNSQVLSERALEGYCSFHHMLLTFARENPEVERMANEAVDKFLASPAFRSKAHTPDLGEWLVNLTLSTAGWEGVAEQFLGELFVRNVRWILQDAPHLAHIHTGRGGGQSALMIDDSFTCTLVSRRLVMFQVYFLKNIGRPNNQSWRDSLTTYHRTMGRPTHSMKAHLHAASKAIMAVASWDEYFDRIWMPRMSGPQLTARLGSAIAESAARNYHRTPRSFGVPSALRTSSSTDTPRFLHQQAASDVSPGSSSTASSSSSPAGDRPLLAHRPGRRARDERDDDRHRPAKRHRRSDSRDRSRSRSRGRDRYHRDHRQGRHDPSYGLDRELGSRRRDDRSRERRRHH
ncbi:Ubiquitinconjugating enzyme subfamily protein [Acanthamoeba castellanii str. Neff]|uniref:Ubiquitinconjugating enzyme subfamily protein n=1 Tax=Acanthamoeba castellanii (strain ATCC 30010 / Neff) TaxID=1257118 RepID=L8GGI3_ACACF|nr:Ubiquitinconjugating enzyme subfamily protein [Acanthamoeba castellanii str. Neff]ELR11964.1 Ubiquitinconjugating enzyme subfamily protein [Acanthamoeba castellanii str. Neff]